MTRFLAHYQSPAASDARSCGNFEFESTARLNSKENLRDARLAMLELFGKDAVSWDIDKVERINTRNAKLSGQLELDFRPEKKTPKRLKKDYW